VLEGSNHLEIIGGQHRLVGERGKGDRRMRAFPVIVVGQDASGLVVDDVVIAIERLGSRTEEGRVERMNAGAEFREDRVLELERVGDMIEVGDGVAIGCGIERVRRPVRRAVSMNK
jgi:hypothetical protein